MTDALALRLARTRRRRRPPRSWWLLAFLEANNAFSLAVDLLSIMSGPQPHNLFDAVADALYLVLLWPYVTDPFEKGAPGFIPVVRDIAARHTRSFSLCIVCALTGFSLRLFHL